MLGCVQPGGGLGLGAEPRQLALAGDRPAEDHLQRDDAVQPGLPRPEHHAHPPAAQHVEDLVAGHVRQRLHARRGFASAGFDMRRGQRARGLRRGVDLELQLELCRELREAADELGRVGRLAGLLAEEELVVEQRPPPSRRRP